jgi:hypothetical protein
MEKNINEENPTELKTKVGYLVKFPLIDIEPQP